MKYLVVASDKTLYDELKAFLKLKKRDNVRVIFERRHKERPSTTLKVLERAHSLV